jgi:hypothetical protein
MVRFKAQEGTGYMCVWQFHRVFGRGIPTKHRLQASGGGTQEGGVEWALGLERDGEGFLKDSHLELDFEGRMVYQQGLFMLQVT